MAYGCQIGSFRFLVSTFVQALSSRVKLGIGLSLAADGKTRCLVLLAMTSEG